MKKIGIKTLLLLSVVMAFLLFLPIMSSAADISWTTEQYIAGVTYELWYQRPNGGNLATSYDEQQDRIYAFCMFPCI